MPMPKKTHCRCGKPKNSETTATLTDFEGRKKLHYLCRECDAKRSRLQNYKDKSIQELFDLRSKFYRLAAGVDSIIEERLKRASADNYLAQSKNTPFLGKGEQLDVSRKAETEDYFGTGKVPYGDYSDDYPE